MGITDLSLSAMNDLIITGGKDTKVKVWVVARYEI